MMQKFPLGRRFYAEILAQANVNLIENLVAQGRFDEAARRQGALKQEAAGEEYYILRHQWESRLNLIYAKLLFTQNDLGGAEKLTRENLQRAQRHYGKNGKGAL